MKKQFVILGLAPIFALAACGGNDGDMTNAGAGNVLTADTYGDVNASDNAMMDDQLASPGQTFANDVGASDYYEVEAGKIAQEKATAQGLKDFGAMMVEHHTASTEKLKAAGAQASPAITPNPALTAEQEANLAALRAAEGAAFDAAYKTQQVAAHEKTLALVKGYAADGDVPQLKAFATEATKVVQAHLTKIQGM